MEKKGFVFSRDPKFSAEAPQGASSILRRTSHLGPAGSSSLKQVADQQKAHRSQDP